MRLRLGAFARYRPRVLTVVVFFAIAALIIMSNLTHVELWAERDWSSGELRDKSYGWPLIWHRYVSSNFGEIGWYYSLSRLTANLAMWLAMLIAPTVACEWLVRRYRPRLRWSMRTMLIVIGLAAVFLAWFAAARDRARLQDAIIAPSGPYRYIWVERWGPKWLDLVGADPFRRQINLVGLKMTVSDEVDLTNLNHLKNLHSLRHLEIEVDCLTPEIAMAVSELRQLRTLSIKETDQDGDHGERKWRESLAAINKMEQLEFLHISFPTARGKQLAQLNALANLRSLRLDGLVIHDDESISHECLQAVGRISQLEYLELNWMKIRDESFACLDGLSKLRLLSLQYVRARESPLLTRLPPLPQLKAIDVVSSNAGDLDLRRLTSLPRLTSLRLAGTAVTPAGLREFMAHSDVEELALENDLASAEGLKSLLDSKYLKTLHLGRNVSRGGTRWGTLALDRDNYVKVPEQDFERCRRTLEVLRDSHRGIVVDGHTSAINADWRSRSEPSYSSDNDSCRQFTWLPEPSMPWMSPADQADFEKAGGWASFDGAGFRHDDGSTCTIRF